MFSEKKRTSTQKVVSKRSVIRRSAVDVSLSPLISKLPGVDMDSYVFHQRKAIGNRQLNLQADNKPRTLRFADSSCDIE